MMLFTNYNAFALFTNQNTFALTVYSRYATFDVESADGDAAAEDFSSCLPKRMKYGAATLPALYKCHCTLYKGHCTLCK